MHAESTQINISIEKNIHDQVSNREALVWDEPAWASPEYTSDTKYQNKNLQDYISNKYIIIIHQKQNRILKKNANSYYKILFKGANTQSRKKLSRNHHMMELDVQ